jgi:hypothetical protein
VTIDDFDDVLATLITVMLPPAWARTPDDPLVTSEQVLKVLEDHCDALRATIDIPITIPTEGAEHG